MGCGSTDLLDFLHVQLLWKRYTCGFAISFCDDFSCGSAYSSVEIQNKSDEFVVIEGRDYLYSCSVSVMVGGECIFGGGYQGSVCLLL